VKDISPALKAHIKQEVTTLCTCISIRRRDTRTFYFTDSDSPVTVNANTYLPFYAFTRSSMPTSIELDVDTSEFEAILNSKFVNREDVASGLFDYAEVSVFLVNYVDPSMGIMELRTGWVGEVTTREDGTYSAEIRGLTQILTQRVGEAYSPECRADLGDRRCKVAVNPPRWEANRRYREGETVLGVVTRGAGASQVMSVVNHSFETDPINVARAAPTGWTGYGSPQAGWQTKNAAYAGLAGAADGGKYVFASRLSGQPGQIGMYQDLDLVAQGIDVGQIDTGLCRFFASAWAAQLQSDKVYWRMSIVSLDAQGINPQTIYDSGLKHTAEDRWVQQTCPNVLIPTGTRYLRIDLFSSKKPSDEAGTAFDDVKAVINYAYGTYESAHEFGGVAFRATKDGTSGPTEPEFSNVFGEFTADGTTEWVTIRSFRSAVLDVDAVESSKSLRMNYMTEDDGYYDGGLLVWQTGRNSGHSFEIQTQVDNQVVTFQRPFYPIAVGDQCILYPGCDKMAQTCIDKFDNIINIRAEPNVPGQDEYYKTPNAHLEE